VSGVVRHGFPSTSARRTLAPGWPHWTYLLVLVPALTDVIESGSWPSRPREWLTEVAVGLLIAALVYRIRREHAALAALASTDALTGLGNRRAFQEALAEECVRARRGRQSLSLVCVDLDHFKLVNDRAGHEAGDQILRQLADAIRHVVRARFDRSFRLGGDEFALLLPGSSVGQAETVMARIRERCAQAGTHWREGPLGLSAGIVELDEQESPADFVRRADDAMYRRKAAGRSRTGETGA
jgi:diguanylate cyclase (GGDEF)-like protein